MGFVKVGKVADVPKNGMKGYIANGKKMVVANIDGKLYAIGSVCTHRGGPLDKGAIDGHIVTCPWHGSKFDLTDGKVTGGPAQKDEERYAVKTDGEDILVDL